MNFLERIKNSEIHTTTAIIFLILLLGAVFIWTKNYNFINKFEVAAALSGANNALAFGDKPALSNPDYYESVKKDLIGKQASFVEANLSSMTLRVYKDGNIALEVPILTKGKKDSWWETPAGLYKAESKLKKHLSSFSPVYTDWNVQFQGNFFIHGWPYWKATGDPVASTYSGGCIRLSNADAEAVYDLVDIDMPILVFEDKTSSTNHEYVYSLNMPTITAESYLVADLNNDFVFLEKDSAKVVELGNITKLLTALVVTDFLDIERTVTYNNIKYTVFDLLFPLLIKNSDDVAQTLARPLGSERALSLMQQKANSIGMAHTTIASVDGIEASNPTNAEDVYHLANFLYNYRKFILKLSNNIVSNNAYGTPAIKVENTNPFKLDPTYIGGNISKNSSGKESGVAVFEVKFGEEIRPIALVVINSENASEDIQNSLNYIKSAYK